MRAARRCRTTECDRNVHRFLPAHDHGCGSDWPGPCTRWPVPIAATGLYRADTRGYFAFKSSTYNVFLFFRTIMKKGANGPDPKPAADLAQTTRVYPLWSTEKDVKPMQFPDASGKRVTMMYPVDNTYWTKLKAFVDYEPVSAIDPKLRGVLAGIGIIKGQPFQPTDKQQELLKKAVETGPKMILAYRQLGRPDKRNLYYKDRQYENIWAGGTAEWMQDGYLDVNQRAAYFQFAYSTASAMVMRTLNAGSKYPFTARDAQGQFLNGSNSYKLHLPPDPPAALFWAVTAYNITDGTMPETPQLLPSINGFNNVTTNNDGSVDIWFGPEKPAIPDRMWSKSIALCTFFFRTIAHTRIAGFG
jgi:hypothetical protein